MTNRRLVLLDDDIEIAETEKSKNGGKGSGNFGHAGRPGKVGGSGDGSSSSVEDEFKKGETVQERLAQARVAREKFEKLHEQTKWTQEEAREIAPYFGSFQNTKKVQDYLITGEDSYIGSSSSAKKCADTLKKKMSETTFKEDETLYRGMIISNDKLQSAIDNGFSYDGFQSTTLQGSHAAYLIQRRLATGNYEQSQWTPVLLKINAKKGSHFAASNIQDEFEIVLPDKIKFKVNKQSTSSTGYTILEVDYDE